MKKIILALFLLLPVVVRAAGDIELEDADIDLTDNASLQRGATYYVKYCLGCHSLKYMRYLNIAHDFKAEENDVLQNIAPLGAGIYDKMLTAMNEHDSNRWFGIQPPDLSLIERSRGSDWLYTYLKGFYLDSEKTLGVNNIVFKDVAMPNVFWQLQGLQEAAYKKENGQIVISHLKQVEPGTMSTNDFNTMVNDIVNFLTYVGEPHQLERISMGKYVLLFILMFGVIAYLLKKEYWKDIH